MKPTIVFRPAPFLKILFVTILVSALLGRTTTSWAQTATTTTLTVSPSSSSAAPLQPKTVVTLTATVTAGGAAVYPGRVTFCEATTAANCRFLAALGTAQLTTAGTATIKFVPGGGSHSYIAVFARTTTPIAYTTSTSTPQSVSPAIPYPTATTIASTGSAGNYTLTATVVGTGNATAGPTGSVTFVDTTNGNHLLGTASLGAATPAPSFVNATGSPVAVGGPVNGVAVGDFNGDGIVDFATANYTSGTVSVRLGQGSGTFIEPTGSPITVGSSPLPIAVGDFNGDGRTDLAVANFGSSSVTVLLGNGNGTFTQPMGSPFAVGSSPYSLVVGDFNGDGNADLAVANRTSNTISILLGQGNGTFAPATSVAVGNNPQGLAVGDFNGDGIADLAVANSGLGSNNVSILLGQGNGTFTIGPAVPAGSSPYPIVVGDFNGDGFADLAVANSSSNNVTILFGEGDGTFSSIGSPIAVGSFPQSMVAGDFNGDGFADLAVANSSSNNVIILLGKGDGTFSSIGSPVTVGSFPRAIAMGDFNGDGIADLAVGNELNNNVSILLNQVTQTATATLTGVSVPGAVSHLVNATYPGDTIFSGSTSPTIPLTGSPVATQTTLVLSTAETIVFGTPVTLAATVTPTTAGTVTISGSVQFLDGTTVLGSAPINAAGDATLLVNGSPIPNFAAGTHMLTAVYVGNTSFNSSTSPVVNLTVSATQIEVSLASSTNPSSYGQAVTFTAAVPSGATGAIQFQNNGVALGGPVEISGTTATFTTSALTAGTHAITAVYSGDNNHNPATSGTLEQEVLPAQLTVTATNATRVFGQPNPAFAYTITGFVIGDTQSVVTGTPTLETTAVEFSPVGAYPIVVDHGTLAASNYTFALVNGTLAITKATPGTGGTSAVTVTSVPNPSIWGQNVTFTATVPPNATGMVAFRDGSTTLGTGTILNNQTTFSTTKLAVATHPITAVYVGDTNFNGATSAELSQVVGNATLTVTANNTTRPFGEPNPEFTATITGFVNGDPPSVVSGTPSFSTPATSSSPVGEYPIEVTEGSLAAANYDFTFVPGTLLITSITPTITLTSSPNPSFFGNAVTFTATVPAAATGTVSFLDGTTTLDMVTITGNTVTFSTSALAAGIHSIMALYSGDNNHEASTSNVVSQVVTTTTTTLSSNVNPQIQGLPVTFTAEVIPTPEGLLPPTGTVTFNEGTTVLGSGSVNSGGLATFTTSALSVGTHTITAAYSGDSLYPASTSSLVQAIVASLPETIEPGAGGGGNDQTAVYGNAFAQPLSVVVTLSNGTPAVGVPVTFTGAGLNFSSGGSVPTDNNGVASVTATGTQVGGFVVTATTAGVSQVVSFALTVTPAPLTVTANNATRVFGAANPAFTGTITGAVFNDTFTFSATTIATTSSPVGTYPIVPSVTGAALSNYTVTHVNGTLTITKAPGSVVLSTPTTPSQPSSLVTLTADVPAGATGTVTFYDGTTALGTATIVNGTASLTVSLAPGSHSITAIYNGDANFSSATSSPVTVTIVAPDFGVSSPAPPQVIPPGASANFAISISSLAAPFTNPVTLTASGLPAGATYVFNPNPVTPGAIGVNSTLTVTVPKQSAMLDRTYRTPLVLAVLLLPLAALRRARGRPSRLLLAFVLALTSLAVSVGCGTGGYFNQPQQTYIITVTGTSGTLVHSTTVTLTVQ